MTQQRAFVELEIDAQNTFTPALTVAPESKVAISISGGATATVFLQRRFDGTNWRDVKSWTADAEETYEGDSACELRLGVKTGGYGSGDALCRLQVG